MKKLILACLVAFQQFGCGSDNAVSKSLATIEIISSNGNYLSIGSITTLTLKGYDQFNESIAIKGIPTWSSDTDNVAVRNDGVVTALSIGTSMVSAKVNEVSTDYTITVFEEAIRTLTTIKIQSSDGDRIDLNNTIQLSIIGTDQFNAPFELSSSIEWSSNNSNIIIDQDGKVTGVSVGNSLISAKVEGLSEEFEITIWDSTAPRTEIYVSDAGNFSNSGFKILKFDENGDFPEIFIDKNLSWPQDIVFLENEGVVLISNLNSNSIGRYDASTGNYIDNFAINIAGPTRMKIGTDNLLYVLQWLGDGFVKRYQLDGTFVDNFTNKGVSQSIGMAWDSDGNLYVSSFKDKYIRKFDTSGK